MKKKVLTRLASFFNKQQDDVQAEEVKDRLKLTLDSAPAMYALIIDGVLSEVNEYARIQVGLEPGDDIREFCDDLKQWNVPVNNAGRDKHTIIRIKMKTGEVRRFLGSLTAVNHQRQEAFILWGIDIEESELRTDSLRYSQKSLLTILETVPMPIRIADSESGEIVYGNEIFWELLEYDLPDERQGLKIKDILPEMQTGGKVSIEKSNLTSEAPESHFFKTEYRTRTGKLIEALVVTRKIYYKGRSSSLGVIKDIAAEKEHQAKPEEKEKEVSRLKGELLLDVSNEISTPLNGIIGMTDLLLGEKITGRQMQYVTSIKESTKFLLNIVDDVMDYAKISEGKLQILPVDFEFGAFLKNIVAITRFSARSKGLEFLNKISIKSPEYVRADEIRLRQVLLNLLSNAIKFTKAGSISFFVKIDAGNILFKVSDTGIGVKPEDIPLLFTEFGQVDDHINRKVKGTGLSMFISKELVDAMGGKIWLESEYGVGSHFYVTIPHIPGDKAAVKEGDTEFEYINAPTAKILLVDDIQSNLEVTAGLLRLCGITADIAMSGSEAINRVREKDYDIIFMDYMMPEMDGVEAMKIVRGLGEKYAKMPIIALTAGSVGEARDFLLGEGMDDFLSKPLDKAPLMNVLKKWLPAGKIESVANRNTIDQNAAYSEILQSVSKIEGMDIQPALNRIGGMQDALERSLIQVAKSISGYLSKMNEHLSQKNLKDFSVMIHGMKGSLANIGAVRYSELAAELEILSKAGNTTLCTEKFTVFADIMSEFLAKLNGIFLQVGVKDLPKGDRLFLTQKAKAVASLLEEYEIDEARSCINEMFDFTYDEATDKVLSDIKDAFSAANYKDVIAGLAIIYMNGD